MMHSPPPQIENIFSKNYVAYSNKYFMIVILWKYSYGDEWWCLYDKDRHMYNQAQVLRIMWVHTYVQFLVLFALTRQLFHGCGSSVFHICLCVNFPSLRNRPPLGTLLACYKFSASACESLSRVIIATYSQMSRKLSQTK